MTDKAARYPDKPWHHLYGTSRWKRAKASQRNKEPLCRMCAAQGRVTEMEVVDHIIPHKGDEALFFDPANWQSLCKVHHDGAKKAQELSGHARGCDSDGWPYDPDFRR